MTEDKSRKPVSISPCDMVDDAASAIAAMTLNRFLSGPGAKMLETSSTDAWVQTSSRPRLRGMMDRYEDFTNTSDISMFSIFRVQELHWISYCQTNSIISRLLISRKRTLKVLAKSRYSDITSPKADVADFDIGRPYGDPINVNHHMVVGASLIEISKAFLLNPSIFREIGRGWSLTTTQDNPYAEWSEEIFAPILEKLLERAQKLDAANREALYILKYRKRALKEGENDDENDDDEK